MLALLAFSLFLGSCKNDETTVTYSDDCYISSVSLSNLRLVHHVKDSKGQDSSYATTYVASAFPMTINQRTGVIENKDSLPFHTVADRVLMTAGYTSALVWRKALNEASQDTTWHVFSSKDSLDLSTPIELAAVASNGVNLRKYTLKVNIHQQRGDSTVWDVAEPLEAAATGADVRLIVKDKLLMALYNDAAGMLHTAVRAAQRTAAWADHTTSLANALPQTVQLLDGKLYLSTSDGQVMQSTNGITWQAGDFAGQEGLRLVGAGEARLYAICQGQLLSSDGTAWVQERLDDDAANLPRQEVRSVAYSQESGVHRMILYGERQGETVVWGKAWGTQPEEQEPWMYYTYNGSLAKRLPALQQLNVIAYDDALVALGGAGADGTTKALAQALRSPDHGVSWTTYEQGDLNIDAALQTAAQGARYIDVAVDENNFLWVMVDGRLWRGRINRLGFQQR